MTDRLERMLQSAQSQGPSREFVSQLRAEYVEELETIERSRVILDDRDSVAPIVELGPPDIQPPPAPDSRWRLILAAAAAAIALVAGSLLILSQESSLDTIDSPEVPDTPTTTTTAQDLEESGGALENEVLSVTAENTFVDPGMYRTDALGTPFTFTASETSNLWQNGDGVFMIGALTQRNIEDRTLTLRRVRTLPSPAAPTGSANQLDGWPIGDLSGWLEALDEDVVHGDLSTTSVGGSPAVRIDITIGQFGCRAQGQCPGEVPLFNEWSGPLFRVGSQYSMWLIEQDVGDPILAVAAIDDETDEGWFEQAEEILATVELGDSAPDPVRVLAEGPREFDVFGGVELTLPEPGVVTVERFAGSALLFPSSVPGRVDFLTSPLDLEGSLLTQTDDLIAPLERRAIAVVEIAPAAIDGREARVFQIESGGLPQATALRRPEDLDRRESGWVPPEQGQIWVIEEPDLGLLVIASQAIGDDEVAAVTAWTDRLLAELEFLVE